MVKLADIWNAHAIQEIHDGLDFSAASDLGGYSFGIFSVKFSTDGRELVAGSSDDSIYVYDLEANKLSLKILAHTVKTTMMTFISDISFSIHVAYLTDTYNDILFVHCCRN